MLDEECQAMKETHWNIDWSKKYDNIYTPVCLYAHQGCIYLIENTRHIEHHRICQLPVDKWLI